MEGVLSEGVLSEGVLSEGVLSGGGFVLPSGCAGGLGWWGKLSSRGASRVQLSG